MFVPAKPIYFIRAALANLQPDTKVQIPSGMGGTFTLQVKEVVNERITLTGGENVPSWYQHITLSFDDALHKIYLLMPSAIYGVTQQHIDVANSAGYIDADEVVNIVAITACTSVGAVRQFLSPPCHA